MTVKTHHHEEEQASHSGRYPLLAGFMESLHIISCEANFWSAFLRGGIGLELCSHKKSVSKAYLDYKKAFILDNLFARFLFTDVGLRTHLRLGLVIRVNWRNLDRATAFARAP